MKKENKPTGIEWISTFQRSSRIKSMKFFFAMFFLTTFLWVVAWGVFLPKILFLVFFIPWLIFMIFVIVYITKLSKKLVKNQTKFAITEFEDKMFTRGGWIVFLLLFFQFFILAKISTILPKKIANTTFAWSTIIFTYVGMSLVLYYYKISLRHRI